MTDRELFEKVLEAMEHLHRTGDTQVFDLCYAPELIPALKERLAQPEQEPVAWRWKERINGDFDSWVISASEPPPYAIEQQPLYTSPPKRGWVGLNHFDWTLLRTTYAPLKRLHHIKETNTDIVAEIVNDWDAFFTAIEAKLREKNQ